MRKIQLYLAAVIARAGAYLNRARSQNLKGKRTEALKDAGEAIGLFSTGKGAGSEKRLGEAYGLRASINCAAGNGKQHRTTP